MNKQPTPQGISALLRKAGFERATTTNNSRHHKAHTAGYHVRTFMGEVSVSHWPKSGLLAAEVPDEVAHARAMLQCYAEAIAAAGWRVKTGMHKVTVTAGETPAPEERP